MARQAFGEDVSITSAAHEDASPAETFGDQSGWAVSSPIPSHCMIEGVIGERVGAGGKTYGIKFAIALPDAWNGRFLLQGGGGLNGTVHPPLGVVATDGRPALARGFAVVSHDSGHSGAVFDRSFMADQRASLDFAEASVRTVTLLGKAITQSYYGKEIGHSYMTGCSTGGREGMLASQRYPELFDGILVGAPAMRAGDSNLGVKYSHVLLNQISPKAPDGTPDVRQLLTPAVRSTLLTGMLDQCDALDGLKDGMIENVAQCRFRPEKLVCTGGNAQECIGADLAEALERSFAGPSDKAGYPIYAPVPFDTGIVDLHDGYLPTGAPGPLGPPNTATSIDLDAEIHAIRNNATRAPDQHELLDQSQHFPGSRRQDDVLPRRLGLLVLALGDLGLLPACRRNQWRGLHRFKPLLHGPGDVPLPGRECVRPVRHALQAGRLGGARRSARSYPGAPAETGG